VLAAGAGPAPREGETSQPVHVALAETLRAFLFASSETRQ
jgi:hypothetical protein